LRTRISIFGEARAGLGIHLIQMELNILKQYVQKSSCEKNVIKDET
jgi:hypothetical protein